MIQGLCRLVQAHGHVRGAGSPWWCDPRARGLSPSTRLAPLSASADSRLHPPMMSRLQYDGILHTTPQAPPPPPRPRRRTCPYTASLVASSDLSNTLYARPLAVETRAPASSAMTTPAATSHGLRLYWKYASMQPAGPHTYQCQAARPPPGGEGGDSSAQSRRPACLACLACAPKDIVPMGSKRPSPDEAPHTQTQAHTVRTHAHTRAHTALHALASNNRETHPWRGGRGWRPRRPTCALRASCR